MVERQAELVRQQEEERQHAQEATLAKQQELERQRAEEARQDAARKQVEGAKLSMAVPPKPPADTAQPAVGVYEGRRPGDTFQDCPECLEMVVIPAGSFTMGSAKSETSRYMRRRGPPHQVTIARAFALGRHEVTYDEWNACLRGGGCTHRPSKSGREPVTYVTWDQATAYVRWLSRKTGVPSPRTVSPASTFTPSRSSGTGLM